jgi:ATP-binding cassette subfamily B protein
MSLFSRVRLRTESLGGLWRALNLVWQASPLWTIASLAVLVGQGLVPLGILYVTKLLIDAVGGAVTSVDKGAAFQQVLVLVAISGGLTLLAATLDTVGRVISEALSHAVTDYMQELIHAKALEVDLEYYESPDYYNRLHRAQVEAPHRPARILKNVLLLVQNAVSLVGIAALLLSVHWMAAILLLAALPEMAARVKYANQMYRWDRDRTRTQRRAEYYSCLLTFGEPAKEIRLFGLGSLFMSRSRELRRQVRRQKLEITVKRSVRELIARCSSIIPLFGAYGYVSYRAIHGAMSVGGLVMYLQAFQRAQSAFQSLLGSVAALYEDRLFLSHVFEFLELKPRVAEPANPRPVPRPMRRGIVFDNVQFSYSGSSRQAISGVSLTIRPGEVVALVGENGSGKTTLIKLLCRLYDPTAGSITVDGVDLRQFGTAEWRSQIGVVFQDHFSYQMTARENIWVGNVELPLVDDRVADAARLSGAEDVVARLEQGYDTMLGTWFDGGEELSIGEWQKVALARAFLRDAQLMILDEPTSALDPRAEAEVFGRFRDLIGGRSAILISHRLSSVRMADRIYVLADGSIVESGTHGELMRRQGTYSNLFDRQAEYYR